MPFSAAVRVSVYGSTTQMNQHLKGLDPKHKKYISPKKHPSTPPLPTISIALNKGFLHKYGQNILFLTMERLQKCRACYFASDDIWITLFSPITSWPENIVTTLTKNSNSTASPLGEKMAAVSEDTTCSNVPVSFRDRCRPIQASKMRPETGENFGTSTILPFPNTNKIKTFTRTYLHRGVEHRSWKIFARPQYYHVWLIGSRTQPFRQITDMYAICH